MGLVRFLTDMGLFIGQSQAFFLLFWTFARVFIVGNDSNAIKRAILLTSRFGHFFVHRPYFLSSF